MKMMNEPIHLSSRTRNYNPGAARFMSVDPIGLRSGDNNSYRYVTNSPASLIDPSGLYGTSKCEYYKQACLVDGGKYECNLAQKACSSAPNNNWGQCVRQCLQEKHKARTSSQNTCGDGGYDQGGPTELPSPNFYGDHRSCFAGCALNSENPYEIFGPDLKDLDINVY